jgi:hypothetical protein
MRKFLLIMVALLLLGGMVCADELWMQNAPSKQSNKPGEGPRFNYYSNANIVGGNILMNVQDEGAYGADFNFLMSTQYPYPPAFSFHTWVNFFYMTKDLGELPGLAYEGEYSLTDSPLGDYAPNFAASATASVDLTSAVAPALSFYTWMDIETGWDFAYVEMYSGGGSGGDDCFSDSPGASYDDTWGTGLGDSSFCTYNSTLDLTGPNPRMEIVFGCDWESSVSSWDGFVIEFSNDGTTWTQIDAGNLQGLYDTTLSSSFGNPLGGQYAICYDHAYPLTYDWDISEFGTYSTAQFRIHCGIDTWYSPNDGLQMCNMRIYDDNGDILNDDCSSLAGYTADPWWGVETLGGGGGWGILAVYSTYAPFWQFQSFDASAYNGAVTPFRFRFDTDGSVQYDGWYIDLVSVDDGATNLFLDDFESGTGQWTLESTWGLTVPIPVVYTADPFDTLNSSLIQGEWVVTSALSPPVPTGPGPYTGSFDDSAAIVPAGGLPVLVDVEFSAFNELGCEDFVLMSYRVTNTGAEDLEDVWAGHWNNFDMNGTYADDYHVYDTDCEMFYTYDNNSDVHGGMKYIAKGENDGLMIPDSPASVNYFYGFDDVTTYMLTTNGEFDAFWDAVQGETFVYTGVGPFDIPAGETLNLCFAMVFGDNLADMKVNVDAAVGKCLAMNPNCIEFDEYPDTLAEIPTGTKINLEWADWGVVIDAFSLNGADDPGAYTGRPGDHPDVEDCIPVSGENFIKTSMEAGDPTSDAGVFTFTFINPYDGSPMTAGKVGVYFLDVEEINAIYVPDGTSRLVAFDAGGAELGAVWVPFGDEGQQYYAEINAPGIAYCKAFVGQPDVGGDSGALDNFCFELDGGACSLAAVREAGRGETQSQAGPTFPNVKDTPMSK